MLTRYIKNSSKELNLKFSSLLLFLFLNWKVQLFYSATFHIQTVERKCLRRAIKRNYVAWFNAISAQRPAVRPHSRCQMALSANSGYNEYASNGYCYFCKLCLQRNSPYPQDVSGNLNKWTNFYKIKQIHFYNKTIT